MSRYTEASAKADIDAPEFQFVRSCVARLCPPTPTHQDVTGSSPSRQMFWGKGGMLPGAFRCTMLLFASLGGSSQCINSLCSQLPSASSPSLHSSSAPLTKLSSRVSKRAWSSAAVWAPSNAAADALALAWCRCPPALALVNRFVRVIDIKRQVCCCV